MGERAYGRKSFREAGSRIVKQEAEAGPPVDRLLGAPDPATEETAASLRVALRRAEDDRREVIALLELSRLALTVADVQQALDGAVALLADVHRHAVVGVWAEGPRGVLRLRAGRGYGTRVTPHLVGDVAVRPLTALRPGEGGQPVHLDRRRQRPAWAGAGADEFLLVAIGREGERYGALVVGRAGEAYGPDDAALATLAAELLAVPLRRWSEDAAAAEAADRHETVAHASVPHGRHVASGED
ncbi:MAG: hypothetical protein ACRDF0_11250 [Candidatus Limnocylindria bacterium]